VNALTPRACAGLLFLAALPAAQAARVETRLEWTDGRPAARIALLADGPAPTNAVAVPLELFDAKDESLWKTQAVVQPAAPARVELPVSAENKQTLRLSVSARSDGLGLDYAEDLRFTQAEAPLLYYGFGRQGVFPEAEAFLNLGLRGFKQAEHPEVPVSIALTDQAENSLLNTVRAVQPGREPTHHHLRISPPMDAEPVGPFRADVEIQGDAYGISFSTSHRFAFANAHVPVTSFEHGDPTVWFGAAGEPSSYPSLQYYYSPHLCGLAPFKGPGPAYDPAEKHGGRQSLRLDYTPGQPAHAWARQWLPGRPTVLTVWVKGNGSGDLLRVTFEDFINYSLPAWQRNANFSTETVCALDFEGWRRFRVPVLGDGLQQPGIKGSTTAVDAPIGLMAFSVHPAQRPRRKDAPVEETRTVWLDDIGVETQAPLADRATLELQASQPDGELAADGRIRCSVGNGLRKDIARGRLSIVARDGAGETVLTSTLELPVAAGAYATAEWPLADLAARKPRGPVDVDVTFLTPDEAGVRVTRRVTLKAAAEKGLFLDFETPSVYSGYAYGRVWPPTARVVDGGAEGSARALALPVDPASTNNSVLFHPALPGIVDSVELTLRSDGPLVNAQVWFVDNGLNGVWLRPHNLFWPAPVTIEGKEWRTVTIKAPPIPAHYADRNVYFLFRPSYPLNLAISATTATGGPPATLFVDNVRVLTHLRSDSPVKAEIEFPDESGLHAPGAPLRLTLDNYAPAPTNLLLRYRLASYQGTVAAEGETPVTLAAGEKKRVTLVGSLAAGIADLTVGGATPAPLRAPILVRDATQAFGPAPLATLTNAVALRQGLGITTERLYLDWDNTEPVPNLLHYDWFSTELNRKGGGGAYRMVPVVGFSADWAGPEAADALARGAYERYIPNLYQVPARLEDWSRFVRELLREYKGRFDEWTFWENPDLEDGPQSIPPERYGDMLRLFQQWVRLYDPKARVTAGGFNFQRILAYLDRVPDPAGLAFDNLAIQVNLGELSPEAADLEGFLDEVNRTLQIPETGRRLQLTELDWAVGPYVTPLQQAAYHARAALILHSRGVPPHQQVLVNSDLTLDGYGVFYRRPYGNSLDLQSHRAFHVAKPSYFALTGAREFLAGWTFVAAVELPDRCLDDNRAFIYRNAAGELAVALWRVAEGERAFALPAAWAGVTCQDIFGVPVPLAGGARCTALPFVLRFPAGAKVEDVTDALRTLRTADGTWPVWLDLHLAEPDSARRAQYARTGTVREERRTGVIPAGRRVSETTLYGLETETFRFAAPAAGDALLRRRWQFEGGQKLFVKLNDGAEQTWDLTEGQGNDAGVRESTWVLRGVRAGENAVSVRYEKPGNCAGYRVEPVEGNAVDLARWGVLNTRQARGSVQGYRSATGTPLRIGKQDYASGLGAHAVSFLEYPLDGQFKAFEVTVGIDGSTEGRGSAVFRVFVDGKEKAATGVVTGFSKPQTLRVDELAGARRLVLSVLDAGDGDRNDLANWVDGKLFLP
jgi:hypothetical protein